MKVSISGIAALMTPITAVHALIASGSAATAARKYKYSVIKGCAPIHSLSIDRIDFEIVADEITYSDGTVYPACLGRLYIEDGNMAEPVKTFHPLTTLQ